MITNTSKCVNGLKYFYGRKRDYNNKPTIITNTSKGVNGLKYFYRRKRERLVGKERTG